MPGERFVHTRQGAQGGVGAGLDRRILHVCTRYQRGGSERRIRDMAAALPEFRHDLVVGGDSDIELAKAQSGATTVRMLTPLTRAPQPASDLAAARALSRLISRGGYDLVVTHQSKAGVLVRAVAPRGVPVVQSLSMASFGPGYGWIERIVFRGVERALSRRSAAVCVVGSDLGARAAGVGVPPERIHVIRSGVALPTVLPNRHAVRRALCAEIGVEPGRPLILYLGSLEPRKNVAQLPDLLAGVLAVHDRRPFLLVLGDGPERAALDTRLEGLGLERDAALVGHVSEPARVLDSLRAADVVVLLSSAEGLPQVLVQAAAVGTPFVAYDVDGVREVLRLGARGEVVPLGDLAGAAAMTARLLAAEQSGQEPVADLSSWEPAAICAGYRRVVAAALATSAWQGRGLPAGNS